MAKGFSKTEVNWRHFWVACYHPNDSEPVWMSIWVPDQRNRKQENTEAWKIASLVMACEYAPGGEQLWETMMLFHGSRDITDPDELTGDDLLMQFENKPGPGLRTVNTQKLVQSYGKKRQSIKELLSAC